MSNLGLSARVLLGLSAFTLLSGCTGVNPVSPSSIIKSLAFQGAVHGGQQPVSGATIQLYDVGTTGDGSAATPLLTSSVQTDASGNFSITGKYACTGGDYVYLVATGGNPGSGTNPNLAMMAALGACGNLTSSTFIFVNEVTTVGSIAALYPYMTSYSALGSGPSDAPAFGGAFAHVSIFTDTTTGSAPGPSLPSGYYASSTEIDTLGNILAACINSTGGVAGDSSPCGNLFNLTRSGGVAPTNTIGAMLNIINNPTQNASSLFALATAVTPFQPVLSSAPSSWALPILQIAAPPSFSIVGGTYSSAQFVTLSDTTPGVTIYYTTDGSTPTASSLTYTGTITVSSTETLKAIALGGGYASSTIASASYTITGSTSTYSINEQINLSNGCSGTSVPPVTLTLSHSGITVQTTTTSNGSFSFSGVPNGTYTITPSISGPAAVFYPASQTAVVNGSNLNSLGFTASIGYTVSGTVAYSGSQTGWTYLALNPTSNCGGGTVGTSISTKGAFTIHGVPPGSYTLQASMDNLGTGNPNASNPTGSISANVTTANLTSQTVTLTDPAAVTVASGPNIQGVSGFNNGAVVQYKAITNSSGVETPSSYTLQWSTSPTFATITGSLPFVANGTKADAWFVHGLTDPVLYFRAYGSSAGTPVSPLSSIYGPVTIGAPTGGNTVSGAISFSTTPAMNAPMYVGFLSQTNGNFYAQYIPSPASAQAYAIQVPSDTYNFFAILDQNGNGLIDAGDVQDATENGSSSAATVISGPQSNLNLVLPATSASATVTTQFTSSVAPGNTFQSYSLNFQVNGLIKLPVAVSLTSGPNLINPIDIAVCGGIGSMCGHGFQINFGIGTTVPSVGDTYTFGVTYSDGSTGVITATVSGVLNALPTNLAPQTGSSVSTTPTFTWTDPVNASNYTYQFSLCCSNNSNIWTVPGQNSNSNGFSSTITSIPWITSGNDVTGSSGNLPSVSALTLSTVYSWSIQVQDSNGNSAQKVVQYQP